MRLALVLICLSIFSQAVMAQGINAGTQQPQAGQPSPTAQAQDIELSCSDVALRLLLTNPEGIKFTPPPGPIGNSVNKVVVYYPDAGAHNEQVLDEIISLLKQAKNGTYVPPNLRQASVLNQPQPGAGGMAQPQTPPGRQDSLFTGGVGGNGFGTGISNNSSDAGLGTTYPYPAENPGGNQAAGESRFNPAGQGFPAQTSPDANRFPAPSPLERRPTEQFPTSNPQSLIPPSSWQPPGTGLPAAGTSMVGIQRPVTNQFGSQDYVGTQPGGMQAGQSSGNVMLDQLINQFQALNDQLQYQNSKMSLLQQDNYNLRNERVAAQLATRDGLPGAAGSLLTGLPDPGDVSQSGVRTASNQRRPTSLGQPANIPGPEFIQATHDARLLLLWLFLVGSIGLNIYLGMIARGLYVRYADLADELRETFATTG